MPIEFRCQQCGRLLRTPDNTAGKQAKCPECEAIVPIPEPGAAVPPPPQPPAGGGGAGGDAGGGFTTPPPSGPRPGSAFGPGAPVNPYESPYAPGATVAPPAAPGGFGPTRIDMGDVFSRTWEIFKREWGNCLGAIFVVAIINIGLSLATMIVTVVFARVVREPVLAVPFNVLVHLVEVFVSVWLSIGQMIFFLKVARGENATLSDLFTGGPYLVRFIVTCIVVGLIVLAGFVLCIIPGIILGLMFSQCLYLIIDRNVDISDSLSLSREITRGNKWMLFLTYLVAQLIGLLVIVFTCGFGVFAVIPYLTLLPAVIYLAMTGQPTADQRYYGYPGPQQPVA